MKKRLSLTAPYNTRSSSVNALTSSSGIIGIGVIGVMIIGQVARSSDKDVRYINCFPMRVDPAEGKFKTVKRPGCVTAFTPAAGSGGVDIHVWQGNGSKVISAFGIINSTIYDTITSLGAITGRCTGITETSISATATLVFSSDNSTAWFYQTVLTQITDGDFPGNASRTLVGTFAHMDGYAFIMDSTGRIYNSDLNSIANWTAASFITAAAVPDVGVGVINFRDTHIIAFSKKHFEVFRNVGNAAGSPLAPVKGMGQAIGCVSAGAITSIKDTVFFAGASEQGVVSIYAYGGGAAQVVSTPFINAQLVLAGAANIKLTAVGCYGLHIVIVKASNVSYGYVIESDFWFELNSAVPLWTKAAGITSGSTMVCYLVSDVSTSGKVFVFNPASISYQDNGSAFTAAVQTERDDSGTNEYKTCSRIDVIADMETETSALGITFYDDDYVTPSTTRTVDLHDANPFITRCGRYRRRSYTLTHSANTPMGLEALELTLS